MSSENFVTAAEFSEDAAPARDGTVPGERDKMLLTKEKLHTQAKKYYETTFYETNVLFLLP